MVTAVISGVIPVILLGMGWLLRQIRDSLRAHTRLHSSTWEALSALGTESYDTRNRLHDIETDRGLSPLPPRHDAVDVIERLRAGIAKDG